MGKNDLKRRFVWLCPLLIVACILLFGCGDEASLVEPVDDSDPPPIETIDTIPPAAVDQLVCTSPGVNSLALQWVAPGDNGWEGTACNYDIRQSTAPITKENWDQATPVTRRPDPVPGGKVQISRATKLVPASTYYFAMKTCDEAGNESGLSNVVYGTTAQERMPPSPIVDFSVSEIEPGTYELTWTASGDDGVLGTATTYDIRFRRQEIVNDNNWSTSQRIANVSSPGSSGETESVIFTPEWPAADWSLAIKVADEADNWSPISNLAFVPGLQNYLWSYPSAIDMGDELTVTFRANGEENISLELFRIVDTCGNGDVTLFSGTPEAGVYSIVYDFKDEENGGYLDPDWYILSICVDGEHREVDRVQFAQ